MSEIVPFFVKISALVAMILLSMAAYAESPFFQPASQRLRVDFTESPEWLEIDRVYSEPAKITVHLVGGEHRIAYVADFLEDGRASPELVSAFKNTVNSRAVLFVIVKWNYYFSGIDTEGDYYEVHAYEAWGAEGGFIYLSEDKKLSRCFGSGFDGKREGRLVRFKYKDAMSIRYALRLESNICRFN